MADSYIVEISVIGGKVSVKELDRVSGSLKKVDKNADKATRAMAKIKNVAKVAAVGIGFVGVAAGAAAIKLVGLASELEETQSKFNTVFKDLAVTANAWAEDFGKSVGRAEVDVKRWMSGLQDTFVPLGIAREESFALSKTLTTLAVDVASFNNAADSETIDLFTSALVGNHEAVRRFGIIITESELKLEAQRQGLETNVAQMTALQKVQLRYNLIIRATTDAQGDALRTADSYANQQKRLQANLKDTATEIGTRLLPAATKIVTAMNEWIAANQTLIDQAADFASWLVGGEIDGVTKEVRDLTTAIEDLRAQRGDLQSGLAVTAFGSTSGGTTLQDIDNRIKFLEQLISGKNPLSPASPIDLSQGFSMVGGGTVSNTKTIKPTATSGGGGIVGTGGVTSGLRGRPADAAPLTAFEVFSQAPEMVRVTEEAFEQMGSAVTPILQEEAALFDDLIDRTMRYADTAVAIGNAFTGAFVDIATGAKSAGDALLGATIGAAGMMATTWGSVHVAMGTAELLTPGMQATGAAHIKSGVALQVLGGTISGLAGSIGGRGGGGRGGGGGRADFGSGVSTPGGRNNNQGDTVAPTVIIIAADGNRSVGTGSLGRRMLIDSVDNRQLGYTIAELRRTGASLDG